MTSWPTLDSGFSTYELSDTFSAASTVEALLEFEAALARGLADTGIAPVEEAEELARACDDPVESPEAILASTWERGTPLLELREEVVARVPEPVGRWFHHGATTQDAIDTGMMLQARAGLQAIDDDLTSIGSRLRDLTMEHRDQPQMGRTFLQEATPTTFGLTTARWLAAVLEHRRDLKQVKDALPVQMGGSSGALDAYGADGTELIVAVARRLGLRPSSSWHTDRTIVLKTAQVLQRTSRTMAKIATDVALLTSSGIDEISVRSGGSSSMPAKENPVDSIRAVAAASACDGAVTMLTSAPPAQLERGVGGWHVERLAVPLAFRTAGASVEAMKACLHSLRVHGDVMAARVEESERAAVIAAAGSQIDLLLSGLH